MKEQTLFVYYCN